MGRKPVLSLVGMFLAGVTLTGCENTDWCCFGNKTEKPVIRPAPNWNTPPQNQAPATTGFNRTTTPADQAIVKPDTSTLPMRDSNVVAPQSGLKDTTTTSVGASDIVPPSPPMPGPDRQPTAVRPVDNTPLDPLPSVPRTSTPRVDLDPQFDPPPAQPVTPRPSEQRVDPLPPQPEPPSGLESPPPPVPAPGSPMKSGSTSKYQSPPLSPLDIEPPPPPKGVPVMPGAGPSGN